MVTYACVLLFLAANRAWPGAKLLLVGTAMNITVIVANGGYMPVTTEALARSGHLDRVVTRHGREYVLGSKDVVLEFSEMRLPFLSDVFSLPEPLPFPASFSPGDLLIAAGAFGLAYHAVPRCRSGSGVHSPWARGCDRGGRGSEGTGESQEGDHVGRYGSPDDRARPYRPPLP